MEGSHFPFIYIGLPPQRKEMNSWKQWKNTARWLPQPFELKNKKINKPMEAMEGKNLCYKGE